MILANITNPDDDDISSEEHRGRGRHISKREVGCIVVVLAALLAIVVPLWVKGVGGGEDSFCRANLRAIGQAILLYSADNADRLPPTYYKNADLGATPALVNGLPVTWATQVQPLESTRQNFNCPTAKPEESIGTISIKEGEKSFLLSYGMYRGLSTVPRIQIPDPGTSVMIAETSNNGSKDTYDPMPFGPDLPDGFLIGWDDNNIEFSKNSKNVTRLSFFGTKNGFGGQDIKGRHEDHVNAISVNGSYIQLHLLDTKVEHSRPRLSGKWWADPNLFDRPALN